MGQGLHTMLGYGVIAGPEQLYTEDGDNRHNEIIVASLAELLDTAYEARPDFLILRLAVDEGFLQDWWKLPDLPHEALGGSVGKRQAKQIPVDESKLSGELQVAVDLASARLSCSTIQGLLITMARFTTLSFTATLARRANARFHMFCLGGNGARYNGNYGNQKTRLDVAAAG